MRHAGETIRTRWQAVAGFSLAEPSGAAAALHREPLQANTAAGTQYGWLRWLTTRGLSRAARLTAADLDCNARQCLRNMGNCPSLVMRTIKYSWGFVGQAFLVPHCIGDMCRVGCAGARQDRSIILRTARGRRGTGG
jgi:hypothetical protein